MVDILRHNFLFNSEQLKHRRHISRLKSQKKDEEEREREGGKNFLSKSKQMSNWDLMNSEKLLLCALLLSLSLNQKKVALKNHRRWEINQWCSEEGGK